MKLTVLHGRSNPNTHFKGVVLKLYSLIAVNKSQRGRVLISATNRCQDVSGVAFQWWRSTPTMRLRSSPGLSVSLRLAVFHLFFMSSWKEKGTKSC